MKALWVITALAAALGGCALVLAIFAGSAPQQAALAAIAVALAVIPYVFTRAVEGITRK
jgi:uncharacterized membrane protein